MTRSTTSEQTGIEGSANSGPLTPQPSTPVVSVRILPRTESHQFQIDPAASLSDMLNQGLATFDLALVPAPAPPLDVLRNLHRDGTPGPVIDDLDQSVGAFLHGPMTTADFGIETVLAIRVNAQWRVATSAAMTPRQILNLFALDPTEFTLYPHDSPLLLPPDEPIRLKRGTAFEAQKDGRYGQ